MMWRREWGRVRMEGESKDTLMGVPKILYSQRQDNPEPHSINLVALSLSWPGSGKKRKRRTWVRTALDMEASPQVTSGMPPFGSKNRKSTREHRMWKMRPKIGVSRNQEPPFTNFVKNTPFFSKKKCLVTTPNFHLHPGHSVVSSLWTSSFPCQFQPISLVPRNCRKGKSSWEKKRRQKEELKEVTSPLPRTTLQYPRTLWRTRTIMATKIHSSWDKRP